MAVVCPRFHKASKNCIIGFCLLIFFFFFTPAPIFNGYGVHTVYLSGLNSTMRTIVP